MSYASAEAEGPQSRFPDFVVVLDGSQPQIDPKEFPGVALKFGTLVTDTFARFPDGVYHSDSLGTVTNALTLRFLDPNNKAQYWDAEIEDVLKQSPPLTLPRKYDELVSESFLKRIAIQAFVGGLGGKSVDYRLGLDNVVRSWQRDAATERKLRNLERQAGIRPPMILDPEYGDITNAQLAESTIEALRQAFEGLSGQVVSQKLGLQAQPIGLREMGGLDKFIRQPDGICLDPNVFKR